MSPDKPDKKKQLDKTVKSKIKGLGLDALFHLVDTNQKDGDGYETNSHQAQRKEQNFVGRIKRNLSSFEASSFKDFRQNIVDKIQALKSNLIGIQIDNSAIRILGLKDTDESVSLTRGQYIPIPVAFAGSEEKTNSFIVEKLTENLDQETLQNSYICSILPRNKVIVKFLSLPTQDSAEIERMIEFEVDHHLPFPLAELEYDYQMIGQKDNHSQFILMAIKKDDVNEHLALLKQAGIEPDAVHVSSACLYNTSIHQTSLSDPTLQVNIESDFIDMNVVEDKTLKVTRGVDWGADKLNASLSKGLNVNLDVALKIKNENGILLGKKPTNEVATNVSEISEKWADQLILEIKKTIQQYQLQEGMNAVKQISITGNGSRLINLDEYLKEKLNVKTSYQAPPVDIQTSDHPEIFNQYFHELSILLGLSQRNHLDDAYLNINLLPRTQKMSLETKAKKTQLMTILGIALVGIFFLWMLPNVLLGLQGQSLKSLERRILALQPQVKTVEALQAKAQTIDNYIAIEKSSMDVLREISMLVSLDIIIQRYVFEKNDSITLLGEASSNASVVELSRAVRESRFFKDATLKYTRRKDRQKENVDFEIVCKLNP